MLQRDDDAMSVLMQLYKLNKDHIAAGDLRRAVALQSSKYTIGADYSYEKYSRTFDPMQYASLSLSRRTGFGSVIARLNYAHKFGYIGYQEEVDFYPRIADGKYAYLNYGYSGSNIFPRHRFGAEYFMMFPAAFEGSIGLRYLYFDAESKVGFYTLSIGWYVSDYWISLRAYVTPWKFPIGVTDISRSFNLTVRYYFANPENYIGARIGSGVSPDQKRVLVETGVYDVQVYLFKSQSANLTWQQTISPFTLFNLNFDYTHQELTFSPGEYVDVSAISVWIRVKL
jgi:YaiO family outer membrane protein